MKKTKTQKGITLIALIITIVVLLILAAVTIGEVKDSGIIAHAQNAATRYEQAKADEEEMLKEPLTGTAYGTVSNGLVIFISDGRFIQAYDGDEYTYNYEEISNLGDYTLPGDNTISFSKYYKITMEGQTMLFAGISNDNKFYALIPDTSNQLVIDGGFEYNPDIYLDTLLGKQTYAKVYGKEDEFWIMTSDNKFFYFVNGKLIEYGYEGEFKWEYIDSLNDIEGYENATIINNGYDNST